MSDDGSYDPYVDDYEESSMEIVVETLTGTTFEMTVAPDDTIISIKSKIQRVEGIPVSQQHLLYRLNELTNEERLCDHGITAGSTLRLVLSMRGGPISTRRLASSEHSLAWKELREYVDNSREDMIDKLPPGSKVTVLLFREGDNINLIRVIENEDGTCYPYSDSWYPPRLAPRDTSQSKYHERSTENNTMMNKVIELRKKMAGLSMKKQVKKPTPSATCRNLHDEPSASTSTSTSTSTSSSSRFLSHSSLNVLDEEDAHGACVKFFGDGDLGMANVSDVYSDRFLLVDHRRSTRTVSGRNHCTHRLETTLPKAEDMALAGGRNCTTIQTPSIAILEEETDATMNKKESEYSAAAASPISVASGDANTVTMSQIPSLPGSSRNLLHLAHMPHMMLQEHTDRPKTSPDKYDPKAQEFCNVVFNDAAERSHHNSVKLSVNRRQSLDFSNKTNLPRMQFASSSNSRIDSLEHRAQTYSTSNINTTSTTTTTTRSYHHHHHHHHHPHNNSNTNSNSNLLTSQYASTSKLNSAHLDNHFKYHNGNSNNHNHTEVRTPPLFGRHARIERIRNNANLNPEKYGYSNLGYIANIEKIQNDAVPIRKQYNSRRNLNFVANLEARNTCDPSSYELRPFKLPRRRCNNMDQDNNTSGGNTSKTKTHERPSCSSTTNGSSLTTTTTTTTTTSNTSSSNNSKHRENSNSQSLPPIVQKKTNRTRCAFCNKRLNITTIHTCRCGGIFCSQHRYSEVHGCQYDYKTEGRKILEQANPLVAAPKLPKI